MKLQTKSNITASVGTVLFMVAVFLILWLIYFEVPVEEEDEGVMVSFGEVMEQGGGMPDAPQYMTSEAAEAASTPSAPSQEPLLTQEDESAAEAARVEKERQQKLEAERLAKEKAEAERQAAEQRKKDAAVAKAQQMGALFGQTFSAEGANGQPGDNGKAINGNPLGHGSSGGNTWSLNGRTLIGELPKPTTDFNQAGIVVVTIIVDKNGNVVSARAGAKGTTISDEATRQIAVKAAFKAKFNMVDHPNAVTGTITYYFKFT
ncbi:MAG: cell envelope integrity protein TolA [Paludibacteraceae bacterium]|nr:cell envelope integrity protein TolA [Paludibacteraceae bacterium]